MPQKGFPIPTFMEQGLRVGSHTPNATTDGAVEYHFMTTFGVLHGNRNRLVHYTIIVPLEQTLSGLLAFLGGTTIAPPG